MEKKRNLEWFVLVLQKQGAILKELLAKLQEYSKNVEHIGIKVLGDKWMRTKEGKIEIEQKLETATHMLQSLVNESISSVNTAKIRKITTASDLLEEDITLLKLVCEITFSPIITKTIGITMSASYIEDLNTFQRKIKKNCETRE